MKPGSIYTKKVMTHFKNPHNMGRITKSDGVGRVGNPKCGDVMWLYIKVKNGKITDVKFETFGCVAAIATSSMVTDLAKGKTLEKVLSITKDDIVKGLGGLPPIKMHCSLLAVDAIHEAIYDYYKKHKLPIPDDLKHEHEMIAKHTEIAEKVGGHKH